MSSYFRAGNEADSSARALGKETHFAETRWTMVLHAGAASSVRQQKALDQLCNRYWYPIYAFVRRSGKPPPDAQDLTQAFFLFLIKNHALAAADPQKGRFRSFLLASLKHFLSDEWDKARAQKRGGDYAIVSMDQLDPEQRYLLEPATDVTPEVLFDRKWALTVLDAGIRRLKEECVAEGKARDFELLKRFLTAEPKPADYQRLSAELDMKPNTIAVTVHRLRQRFSQIVRAEIADTVSSPEELDQELKSLFS